MGLSKQNGLHGNAVEWYYGIMAERGPGVPEAVFRHVWRCLVGRRQTDRLQGAAHGADGEIQGSRSRWLRDARKNMMKRDVIDTLSRHFRCLEEQVTCARVRPFLPGLLLPAVRLRIPTPITVHIDQCGECAEDLAVLRDLGLGDEQLERLERLYQQASSKRPRLNLIHARLCRRARSRIDDFTRGGLEKIDREILDHLCTCPHCRPLVHESRQRLLESDSRVACADEGTKITMAELFDYAVPYGRTEDAVWPDHVRDCPACRRRIQQLDETIYGIAERTDSGIATIYSTIEPERHSPGVARDASDDVSARASDGQDTLRLEDLARWIADPYPQYPIRVQVLRGRP
ncbi:MAG: hypothetical protein FJ280_02370, partial [Planctomycetes bacterium]|nr:hypothetical protein [Planctomycetota bacterium]